MSDDWFDVYAAGEFLPAPVTRKRSDHPVEEYAEGYVDGMDRARQTSRQAYWYGYAAALEDLAEPITLPEREPCRLRPDRLRPLRGARLRTRVRNLARESPSAPDGLRHA